MDELQSRPVSDGIVDRLAEETIGRLSEAGQIGHPGEIGRARENILRDYLTNLVPPGFGLDTGFVIDALGGKSLQQDIVIYRREYHPIFKIGGVFLFPVESVAAVIEVKSTLSTAELKGALENVASVKRLDRRGDVAAVGANYTLIGGAGGKRGEDVDPALHEHQIFAAIVAGGGITAATALPTLQEHIVGHQREVWPNMISIANSWSLSYDNTHLKGVPRSNQMKGTKFRVSPKGFRGNPDPLVDVAEQLWSFLRVAAFVDVTPSSYARGSWYAEETPPFVAVENDMPAV